MSHDLLRWIDWEENYCVAVDNWIAKQGTIFHSPAWQNALCERFGYQAEYQLLVNEQDHIIGALPFCIGRNLQGRRVGVALPFVHYLNPVRCDENLSQSLAVRCSTLWRELDLHYLELRLDYALPVGCDAGLNEGNVTFVLPLEGGESQVLARASSDNRRRTKLVYEAGRFQTSFEKAHLTKFYQVFQRRQKQLGTPAPSLAFFQKIQNVLSENVTLLTVFDKQSKQAVGGMFLLSDGPTLYYHWGATLIEYNAHHLNHFMYREAIKFAIENGFRNFDMGRSPRTEQGGTYRFKAQFGAQVKPLYYYRFGESSSSWSNASEKMKPLIELWKKAPAALTNAVGHFLIGRAFP